MAKDTPVLKDKTIFFHQDDGGSVNVYDMTKPRQHQLFLEVVDTYKAFRFVAADGSSCTVVREKRAHYRNKNDMRVVWYAHKRIGGKLKRKYIGKTKNLTYEKLKTVAFELSQYRLTTE